MRYSSYRISFLSLPIRRAVVRLETAPPRPKSGDGIPEGIRANALRLGERFSSIPPPPSPFFSLFFSSPLDGNLSVRHATDVKLPFHARKRISRVISAPRAAFSTLFSDLRRHVDLIVAIIYERQFGTRPPSAEEFGSCVSTNPGFYHIAKRGELVKEDAVKEWPELSHSASLRDAILAAASPSRFPLPASFCFFHRLVSFLSCSLIATPAKVGYL